MDSIGLFKNFDLLLGARPTRFSPGTGPTKTKTLPAFVQAD
jgi:hypothetical protein